METIIVNGKEYEALYFGQEELTWSNNFAYRKIWRLENAYDDFKNNPKSGIVLPCVEYPMLLEEGQVFVIDYIKVDGTVEREYHRTYGENLEGRLTTEEFIVE